LALLQAVVNDHDAATNVIPTLDAKALLNPTARRIYGACKAVWDTGAPLTPESLAADFQAQIDANASQAECNLLEECRKIVVSDLAKLPAFSDPSKSALEIAKRLSKVPAFEVVSYRQLRARPRLSWLIDQTLPVGGTSWLTASAGAFKSFWAMDAALCIATGRDFHGRSVQAGNVVYVAAEGAAGLPDRLDAWAIRNGCEVPDAPRFGVIERPADVANPAILAGFVASIRALSPVFVVLDTQSRCSVGRDLNSTAEATLFYDAVSALARELGAQVLVLAHNNRSGDYAGNHQGPAMVDTHLSLKREGQNARLRCAKQKDGAPEEAAAMDFTARVVSLGIQDEKGREITSLVLDSAELEPEKEARPKEDSTAKTRAQVLRILADQFPNGARAGEWQEAVEKAGIAKQSNFYNCRDALLKSGSILEANRRYIAFDGAAD
jgi:hypothetical protein